jgi:pimeloyl-ACP methyl ester carboxylesterase
MASAVCRTLPRLARALFRLQLRPSLSRRIVSTVAASGLDDERAESFFGPGRRDRRVVDDYVVAAASFRPQLLIDAAEAIPQFDRPVLLIWGESCDFFPMTDARRLASDFPRATLVSVPGAKTWVPVDNPVAVADAIVTFVPTPGLMS